MMSELDTRHDTYILNNAEMIFVRFIIIYLSQESLDHVGCYVFLNPISCHYEYVSISSSLVKLQTQAYRKSNVKFQEGIVDFFAPSSFPRTWIDYFPHQV